MVKNKIDEYGLSEEFIKLRKEGMPYRRIYEKWLREKVGLPDIPSIACMSRYEEGYEAPLTGINRYNTLHYTIGNSEFIEKTNIFLYKIVDEPDKEERKRLTTAWKMELRMFITAYEGRQRIDEKMIRDFGNQVVDVIRTCPNCQHLEKILFDILDKTDETEE
jgi:hypothetical protein